MMNWLVDILILLICVGVGVTATFFPLRFAWLFSRWPKFLFGSVLGDSFVSPKTRDALRLIDTDPAEYQRRFGRQLLMIRLMGGVGLFMAPIILCIMLSALI